MTILLWTKFLPFFRKKNGTIDDTNRIATLVAQVSILGFLIATSKHYHWVEVVHLLIPFTPAQSGRLWDCQLLYFRSLIQIHQLDRQIFKYKKSHTRIVESM